MGVSYLTVAEFRSLTVMPKAEVALLEQEEYGYLAARLELNSRRIDANLVKRYAAPFVAPFEKVLLGWLEAMTTVDAYEKRGWDPADKQSASIVARYDRAIAEMKEAADAQNGLFDLPLRDDTTTDGVIRGGPSGYSEASPYSWTDVQREAVRNGG